MHATTLEPSFLVAVVTMTAHKPERMKRAQAALLYLGLQGYDFTAADLPAEVTEGSAHLAGAATGALVAQGLLTVVGRVKSPKPDAKGRKLDVLRLTDDRRATAKNWLRANGYATDCQSQTEFRLTA